MKIFPTTIHITFYVLYSLILHQCSALNIQNFNGKINEVLSKNKNFSGLLTSTAWEQPKINNCFEKKDSLEDSLQFLIGYRKFDNLYNIDDDTIVRVNDIYATLQEPDNYHLEEMVNRIASRVDGVSLNGNRNVDGSDSADKSEVGLELSIFDKNGTNELIQAGDLSNFTGFVNSDNLQRQVSGLHEDLEDIKDLENNSVSMINVTDFGEGKLITLKNLETGVSEKQARLLEHLIGDTNISLERVQNGDTVDKFNTHSIKIESREKRNILENIERALSSLCKNDKGKQKKDKNRKRQIGKSSDNTNTTDENENVTEVEKTKQEKVKGKGFDSKGYEDAGSWTPPVPAGKDSFCNNVPSSTAFRSNLTTTGRPQGCRACNYIYQDAGKCTNCSPTFETTTICSQFGNKRSVNRTNATHGKHRGNIRKLKELKTIKD